MNKTSANTKRKRKVDTDSPLASWLTPAIDSTLAARLRPLWFPPACCRLRRCLLGPELVIWGGNGQDLIKWTKKRGNRRKSVSVGSWCLPPRMNGIQRKWEEDVWQLLATLAKKTNICNLGILSMMIREAQHKKSSLSCILQDVATLPHVLQCIPFS